MGRAEKLGVALVFGTGGLYVPESSIQGTLLTF
jgi:hypothetical protein